MEFSPTRTIFCRCNDVVAEEVTDVLRSRGAHRDCLRESLVLHCMQLRPRHPHPRRRSGVLSVSGVGSSLAAMNMAWMFTNVSSTIATIVHLNLNGGANITGGYVSLAGCTATFRTLHVMSSWTLGPC